MQVRSIFGATNQSALAQVRVQVEKRQLGLGARGAVSGLGSEHGTVPVRPERRLGWMLGFGKGSGTLLESDALETG